MLVFCIWSIYIFWTLVFIWSYKVKASSTLFILFSFWPNLGAHTGKPFSEALILESAKPKYDKRLFIGFLEKYKFTTCCVQILFWMSKQNKTKNNVCTQHVVNLYFSWNSMNNLSSYCGLTDSRMRASDTDLPVRIFTIYCHHF